MIFYFKKKTAYGRRISDWSSDVCSSGLIKRDQVEGLENYSLFTRKAATDFCYLACARDMLDAENIRPAFASHNALTVATIVEWAGNTREFEFQRLHGMGDGLYERLVREHDYRCRSEEHTSELQSLMRISYAVFCLKKKKKNIQQY